MNPDSPSSFRKTLLLVIAAHVAVAAIPLTWVSLGPRPPMVAAGPVPLKVEEIQWLDPTLPGVEELPAPVEPAATQIPQPAKVASTSKPSPPRPHLGHVEKLPAAKTKISPPQQVNFHPAVTERSEVNPASAAAVAEHPTSGPEAMAPQEEDLLRAYHERIQRVLESHWQQPTHPATERAPVTKVAITISRAGEVSGVKLAASSGYPEVDRSALAAAHAVPQIDPLPTAVRGDSYQLIIRFVLN
jgi:protein TonB